MRILWLALLLTPLGRAQGQMPEVEALNLTDSIAPISLLDSTVGDYHFFFLAEQHWLAANADLQFRFLMYLHRYAGVRNLIIEGGFCLGELLNMYLQTGDEKLLIRAVYDPAVCPEDQRRFYKRLYAFNQQVPEDQRIYVCGIDYDRSPLQVLETLYRMMPNKPLTAGVREKMEGLQKWQEIEYDDRLATRYLRALHKEMLERKRAYRKYWEEDYLLFRMIMDNTILGFESPLLRDLVYNHREDKRREKRLYYTFRLLYNRGYFREGQFFAQFGAFHTERKPAVKWGYPTLAQSLHTADDSPVQGKVMTIFKYFRNLEPVYQKFPKHEDFLAYLERIDLGNDAPAILCRLTERFPAIAEDYPFILLIDQDWEAKRCR